MKNKLKKQRIMFFVFIGILLFFTNISHAGVTLSQSSVSLATGQNKTVTISASNATGNIAVSSSNTDVATVSISNDWIDNNSLTITINAKNPGNATIYISGTVADEEAKETAVSKSIQVNVSGNGGNSGGNTTSKSSNANLSNLGIKPNDFSGFTPSKTSYSVTVENSVEEISVYATKQDSKASVSGTGKKSLKEGTNKFNIVVTAEDGTKKTYTISVIRKTANENTVPNVTDNPSDNPSETKEEKLRLTAIALPEDLNLVLNPTFNAEVFEYTLEVANEIESLELSGIPSINGSKVTITGNKELQEGENTITLTVTKGGMETVIYTIKVTRKTAEETAATVSVVNTFHSTIPKPFDVAAPIEKNSKIIVLCACLISVVGMSVCIREYMKNRKLAYADEYEEDVSIYEPQVREKVSVTTLEPEIEKTQGRTIDLISPEDWEDEEPRRKRVKGKHF